MTDENEIKKVETEKELLAKLETTNDYDEITKIVQELNVQSIKRHAKRQVKLEDLLDTVDNQAVKRWRERPDEFSNKDIIDTTNMIQNAINFSKNIATNKDNATIIQINSTTNNINTESKDQLSTESKNKILGVVEELLKTCKNNNADVVDVDATEVVEEEKKTD